MKKNIIIILLISLAVLLISLNYDFKIVPKKKDLVKISEPLEVIKKNSEEQSLSISEIINETSIKAKSIFVELTFNDVMGFDLIEEPNPSDYNKFKGNIYKGYEEKEAVRKKIRQKIRQDLVIANNFLKEGKSGLALNSLYQYKKNTEHFFNSIWGERQSKREYFYLPPNFNRYLAIAYLDIFSKFPEGSIVGEDFFQKAKEQIIFISKTSFSPLELNLSEMYLFILIREKNYFEASHILEELIKKFPTDRYLDLLSSIYFEINNDLGFVAKKENKELLQNYNYTNNLYYFSEEYKNFFAVKNKPIFDKSSIRKIYTPFLRQYKMCGWADLKYDVSEKGKVNNVRFVDSNYPMKPSRPIKTLKTFEFFPYIEDGKPVASKDLSHRISYELTERRFCSSFGVLANLPKEYKVHQCDAFLESFERQKYEKYFKSRSMLIDAWFYLKYFVNNEGNVSDVSVVDFFPTRKKVKTNPTKFDGVENVFVPLSRFFDVTLDAFDNRDRQKATKYFTEKTQESINSFKYKAKEGEGLLTKDGYDNDGKWCNALITYPFDLINYNLTP